MEITHKQSNLSIIIPWCNRLDLEKSLLHNRYLFEKNRFLELIVVNCNGDHDWLTDLFRKQKFFKVRLLEVKDTPFNKSLALNLGVSASRANRILFLDSDILLKENTLLELMAAFDESSFVTIKNVLESEISLNNKTSYIKEFSHFLEFVTNNDKKIIIETNRVYFQEGGRSAPGLLLLHREHFLNVDGMNSDLKSWGWEDLDLLIRLQFLFSLRHQKAGSVIHLTHGDRQRNLNNKTRSESEEINFSICLNNYQNGNLKGTYTKDISAWGRKIITSKEFSGLDEYIS